MTAPRVFEFDVTVDRDSTARNGLGGDPIPRRTEWWPEHFVLAGLVRCTLASMDHHARRGALTMSGSGRAHGVVTKREEDGLYAFVEIESSYEVELSPAPAAAALDELIAKAERGCFVGNSLKSRPRYRWTVNGEDVK